MSQRAGTTHDPFNGHTPTSHERLTGLPWDASYRDGQAPWENGRPQPAVVLSGCDKVKGRFARPETAFARFSPHASQRVLYVTHWDTRPVADEDRDVGNRTRPILGANDGASGVGLFLC